MKTVEEYAIDLVVDGAEHSAQFDMNESGDIGDGDWEDAVRFALDMAKAIRENPRSFTDWAESMGVRWNKGA